MGMQMLCHENHVPKCGRNSHIITEENVTEEITLALIKDQNTAIPARSNEDIRKLQMEDWFCTTC